MKAICVYSGGMDSFTVLNMVRNLGHEVHALSFNYGQRHIKELGYARRFCSIEGILHTVVEMQDIGHELLQGSALTSDVDVPEGHYEDETMKQTVVPNRNMIMLSLAIGFAVSQEANAVFIGAHSGDHAIYPDCRPEFINKMNDVAAIANYSPVSVVAPFIGLSKGEIAEWGSKEMGLDYGRTWTCYKGEAFACGKCGACQERIEAMAFAGITDPMKYAS